jgi:hypothetical protein
MLCYKDFISAVAEEENMEPIELGLATSAAWAEISAIAPIILELAVIIAVIALLDWLWSFIEPYAQKLMDIIAEYVVRVRNVREIVTPSLIPH